MQGTAIVNSRYSIPSTHSLTAVLLSSFPHDMASIRLQVVNDIHKAIELVERAVRTVKGLLEGSPDPHMALLSYIATTLSWCSLSPGRSPPIYLNLSLY